MIVPDWDPWELLMTGQQVQISAVSGNALPVVVETENLLVREGNPADSLAISVLAIGIFVNIVSQMYDIVDRIL